MVVDGCHRGYLLDGEMSDAEMSFRNKEDYISKYRRVLEHFDATKIGLTAGDAINPARCRPPRSRNAAAMSSCAVSVWMASGKTTNVMPRVDLPPLANGRQWVAAAGCALEVRHWV